MSFTGQVTMKKFRTASALIAWLAIGLSSWGFNCAVAQEDAVAEPPTGTSVEDNSGKAEDTPGLADLDKAFDLKTNLYQTKSTRDLDKVARLCEQAIEKGLSASGVEQAKVLAKTSYYEYAELIAAQILNGAEPDSRWKQWRREALRRLDKAIAIDDEMASAYVLAAKLQILPLGDRSKGKEAIDKAVSLIDGDDEKLLSEALVVRARLSEDILSDGVRKDVDRAIELDPNNRQARGLRSQLLMRAGKLEEAFEDMDFVLESAGRFEAYAAQADRLLTNPLFARSEVMQKAAIRYLDKARKLKATPRLLYVKASALLRMGKHSEALEAVDEYLESEPDDFKAFSLRSTINLGQGDSEQATTDLDVALEKAPSDDESRANILRNRLRLHLLADNQEKAIKDCETLNGIDEGNFGLQFQLAQLYLGNDQPRKGIAIAGKMLEKYEDGVWEGLPSARAYDAAIKRIAALRTRGDCYLNVGDHQNAVDDYELGVDMTDLVAEFKRSLPPPRRPQFPNTLPQELRDALLENWKAQVSELDKEYVGDAGVLNNLSWVLSTSTFSEVRDGERAIELATLAAEITEFKQPHVLSTLAAGYAEVGEFEKAKEWIDKAIEVNQANMESSQENQELSDSDRAELLKNDQEQFDSLNKERKSYEAGEPWREHQTSEEKQENASQTQDPTEIQSDQSDSKQDPQDEDSDGADGAEGTDR